jgi:hypothetical protein
MQVPLMNPMTEYDWNYQDVPHKPLEDLLCSFVCISDVQHTHVVERSVHHLLFSQKVFCSQNFVNAVLDSDDKVPCPLDFYFRHADVFIAFSDGRILLLSEREAEKVLEVYWTVEGRCVNQYHHLATMGRVFGASTVPLSLPKGNHAICCASAVTSVQLFNGESCYNSEPQKKALKLILSGNDFQKLKRGETAIAASQHILYTRGQSHMYDYSVLEDCCRSIERDEMNEKLRI